MVQQLSKDAVSCATMNGEEMKNDGLGRTLTLHTPQLLTLRTLAVIDRLLLILIDITN